MPIPEAPPQVLLLNNRVTAGFPSPAEDLGAQRIDLTQVLITHPQAIYSLRASGHSMVEVVIVVHAVTLRPSQYVAAMPHVRAKSGVFR